MSHEEMTYVAQRTEGWSGSDLESLVREASLGPLREALPFANVLVEGAQHHRLSSLSSLLPLAPVRYRDFKYSLDKRVPLI